ncbi:MAG TPA: YggS family pyridoxal phosphate-dependent enzyme [Myxococcota bacterium]|nr:YggS family pyridoxal phosphate-dependent enzyme [Myxococcota bacterium]
MSDARATGVRDGGIAARLAELRARAAAAAERAGRSPAEVTLIGVAKRQPAARVVAAVAAGLGDVAENFVHEARDKLPAVREALAARGLAAPRFHLVGRLQTNKARTAAPLFDCVQSVDRLELARELARRAEAAGRTLDALVQVNLSGEPQKGGVAPDGLAALLDACAALPALRLRGLMTVPEETSDAALLRGRFAALRELRDTAVRAGHAGVRELSMGMSADFELAIEAGATWIRIGTALFGAREAAE